MTSELLRLVSQARIFDLAQPYFVGMPHHPVHPPFLYGLAKKHGDYLGPGGVSSASEALALGSHVGTHIDALCHFSCGGKLHGGIDAASAQSYAGGLRQHSVDTIAPIFRRGVLLDIAGQAGVDALAADFQITPEHLEKPRRRMEYRSSRGMWCCCAPGGRVIGTMPRVTSPRCEAQGRRRLERGG